jgi:methionyl-tRNA formyltransferase
MSVTDIVLMSNKSVGLKVAKYFLASKVNIKALFVSGNEPEEDAKVIKLFEGGDTLIFGPGRKHDDFDVITQIGDCDFIITVFWPFLLKEPMLNIARRGSVNFHPALLPSNRGWYPHVFNIIDGSTPGVTLHDIDSGADTGDIWVQKEVEIKGDDISSSLYYRLQDEIYNLFEENWPKIESGEIKKTPQDHNQASYNSKRRTDDYDHLDLDKSYTAREFLNILRARTFEEKGFAYFTDGDGKKIAVAVSLKDIG